MTWAGSHSTWPNTVSQCFLYSSTQRINMDYLKWSWYALWINQLIKWLIMCILSNQFIQLINSFAHSFCRYLLSIFFKCWELRYTDTSSESKNYFTFINVFIALLSNNLSSPTWWRMRTFLDLSINDGESDEAWPGWHEGEEHRSMCSAAGMRALVQSEGIRFGSAEC